MPPPDLSPSPSILPGSCGPVDDRLETTTFWSFPQRGSWATHKGDYPGNWAPEIPRNLIQRYTKPGDLVLDPMVGSGTSLIEARLLGRRGIGVDVNPQALEITKTRTAFPSTSLTILHLGDARDLNMILSDSVDLCLLHPPYWSIIRYSGSIEHDVSRQDSATEFFKSIAEIAREAYRVLRSNGHCAVLMGDTRRHSHFVPLSWATLQCFMEAGFVLRENIIKAQWNVTSERRKWVKNSYPFYKIHHEQLFVFRKPASRDDYDRHSLSTLQGLLPANATTKKGITGNPRKENNLGAVEGL